VELHSDERAETVTGFVERALRFYESRGITVRRLTTDNTFSYVRNGSLHELLVSRQIKHLTTEPYRPRTNGKVERFHQTMAREWAYTGLPTPRIDTETQLCHTGFVTTMSPTLAVTKSRRFIQQVEVNYRG
jgi:transposase InsO family protein